jgi:hypothetical protein
MAQPPPSLPSADLIAEAVHEERRLLLDHFDSLDTKGSALLGFAGVLIALALGATSWWTKAGVIAAVIAAAVAVFALMPRDFPIFRPMRLRRYVRADPALTQRVLLDTEIQMTLESIDLIKRKGSRLRGSFLALLIAVALVGVGTIVGDGNGPHTTGRGRYPVHSRSQRP